MVVGWDSVRRVPPPPRSTCFLVLGHGQKIISGFSLPDIILGTVTTLSRLFCFGGEGNDYSTRKQK